MVHASKQQPCVAFVDLAQGDLHNCCRRHYDIQSGGLVGLAAVNQAEPGDERATEFLPAAAAAAARVVGVAGVASTQSTRVK